jgi:hypothetical protein
MPQDTNQWSEESAPPAAAPHPPPAAELPGYDDPSVAPLWEKAKGSIKAAVPFNFLNYFLLLAILYVTCELLLGFTFYLSKPLGAYLNMFECAAQSNDVCK